MRSFLVLPLFTLLLTTACKESKESKESALVGKPDNENVEKGAPKLAIGHYVQVPQVPLYKKPEDSKSAFVKIPINTGLALSGKIVRGQLYDQEWGEVMGPKKEWRGAFVRMRDLGTKEVAFEDIITKAKEALRYSNIPKSKILANAALHIESNSEDALYLLAATADADEDVELAKRAYSGLKSMGKKPAKLTQLPPSKLDDEDAATGARVYVAASKLRVRDKPSRKGKAVGNLAINDDILIKENAGDWLKIEWEPPRSSKIYSWKEEDADSAAGLSKTNTEKPFGYISSAYVSKEPLSLVDARKSAAAANRSKESADLNLASAWYERAFELSRNADDADAGINAAIKATLYGRAVRLALRKLDFGAAKAGIGELALAYGCRGDVNKAIWIENDSLRLAAIPKDVCVNEIHAPFCPDDPPHDAYNLAALMGGDASDYEEEAANSLENYKNARAEEHEDKSTLIDRLEMLQKEFKTGPLLRVEIDPESKSSLNDSYFVVSRGIYNHGGCETELSGMDFEISAPIKPPPNTEVFWVRVPTYSDVVEALSKYGQKADFQLIGPYYFVVVASSKEAALKTLKSPDADLNMGYYSQDFVPESAVSAPTEECGFGCGC